MMPKEVRINSQELTQNLKQATSLRTKKVQAEEDISKIKVATLVLKQHKSKKTGRKCQSKSASLLENHNLFSKMNPQNTQ